MRGTESDVAGMISATSSMKTVRDSRMVIPADRKRNNTFCKAIDPAVWSPPLSRSVYF